MQPPRSSKSQAGSYPVTIQVASQDMPDQMASVQAKLKVQSYSQFTSELHPQKVRAGTLAQVSVQNDGNSQETFTVSWQDRGNEAAFQPPQAQLSVPPGQVAAAGFHAAPRERRWIGGSVTHNFTARVASSGGETQRHEGELVSRAVFPVWLLPLLFLMCLCLAGAAALAYGLKTSQDTSGTQTMVDLWEGGFATQTAIAATKTTMAQAGVAATDAEQGAQQATAEAGTSTAEAGQQEAAAAATQTALIVQQSNQATVQSVTETAVAAAQAGTATAVAAAQAATATAVWLAGDDDRDGLTNQMEMELNTLPGTRDTDEDGVDDGEEVNTLGTDPMRPDSDGDGLRDGDEVTRGTDPMDPDSDDDGLRDNVDPDPLVPEDEGVDPPVTVPPVEELAYDFAAQASVAAWRNNDGNLPFPGSETDERGFALVRPSTTMEDNRTYRNVLQTHPKWASDGRIIGGYTITVPPNARFKAKVGFMKGPTRTDGATFEVSFVPRAEGGAPPASLRLYSQQHTLTGRLLEIDVSLDRIGRKSGTIYLTVKAGDTATQDWAAWISPRIVL